MHTQQRTGPSRLLMKKRTVARCSRTPSALITVLFTASPLVACVSAHSTGWESPQYRLRPRASTDGSTLGTQEPQSCPQRLGNSQKEPTPHLWFFLASPCL